MQMQGCKGPDSGGQQEAVTWSADGTTLWMVPEGEDPEISRVHVSER